MGVRVYKIYIYKMGNLNKYKYKNKIKKLTLYAGAHPSKLLAWPSAPPRSLAFP